VASPAPRMRSASIRPCRCERARSGAGRVVARWPRPPRRATRRRTRPGWARRTAVTGRAGWSGAAKESPRKRSTSSSSNGRRPNGPHTKITRSQPSGSTARASRPRRRRGAHWRPS
jgi:hypothetical protein